MKLIWQKHRAGGIVAIIPVELGGQVQRASGSSVHIVPHAFGSTKARVRLRNHALEQYFFHHQFYANVTEAKRAVTSKLNEFNW